MKKVGTTIGKSLVMKALKARGASATRDFANQQWIVRTSKGSSIGLKTLQDIWDFLYPPRSQTFEKEPETSEVTPP